MMARRPQRPEPIVLRPPRGPAVHGKAIRPPSKSSPWWYWRAVVYDGGQERTVWTGRADPEEARRQVWAVVGRGEHLAPITEPEAGADEHEVVTLADLFALWRGHLLEHRRDLAAHTLANYLQHSRVIEEVIGDVLIEELSSAHVDHYRAVVTRPPPSGSRRRAARSAGSLRLDMITLAQAWEWGRARGGTPPRDLDLPSIAPKPVRERYTPSAGEVAEVVARLPGWMQQLVRLQWATGARIGELASLRAADVRPDRAELLLGQHEGARKTGGRRVPVHPDTVPLLRDLVEGLGPADRVWPYDARGVTKHLNVALGEQAAALVQPHWTTHALRRAYVVRSVRAGLDPATVASITGHSVGMMMGTYRTVMAEDQRAAALALPGALPRGQVVQLAVGDGDPHIPPAQRRRK
jgi:integrase